MTNLSTNALNLLRNLGFGSSSKNASKSTKVSFTGTPTIDDANATHKRVKSNTNTATNSSQSVNLSINSSINSQISGSNTSSSSSLNFSLVADKSKAVGTSLGYGIDKDGYYTSDFNEAAGIPKDYKIHSSTMESFARMKTNESNLRIFKSVDIAKSVGNAYKILSQVVGESVLNSKDSFTKDEIAGFPQGYSYNIQSLEVTKIYTTLNEQNNAIQAFDSKQARQKREGISNLFYNPTGTKPATNIFDNAYGGKESAEYNQWATTASKYTNSDGSISKGGLLIGILNNNLHTAEGETTTNGKKQGYDKSMSYADMLNYKAEDGEWFVNIDLNTPLSLGEDEPSNEGAKNELKNYKSPLMQALDEMLAQMKERAQKALQKQREKVAEKQNVDIRA